MAKERSSEDHGGEDHGREDHDRTDVETQGWAPKVFVITGAVLTAITMLIIVLVGEYWTKEITSAGTTTKVKVFEVDYWFTTVGVIIGYTIMLGALYLAQTSDSRKGSLGGPQGVTSMLLMVLGGMVLLTVCTTANFRESALGRFCGVGQPIPEKPAVQVAPDGTGAKVTFKVKKPGTVDKWFVTFELPGTDGSELSLPASVKEGEVFYQGRKTQTNSKAVEFKLP